MKKRIVRASLHEHFRTSSNITEDTADRSVERAHERLGRGGVLALINFNPSVGEIDPRWKLFVKRLNYDTINTGNGLYLPQLDLLVVRGQEVPTAEKYHVLLVGTTPKQNIVNGTKLDDVLKEGRAFGADMTAAHPFHGGLGNFLKRNHEYYLKLHGYEVRNALAFFANRKAEREFERIELRYPHLTKRFGNDGHSVYEIGRNFSNIEMPEDYTQFRGSPEYLTVTVQEGFKVNKEKSLGDSRRMSIRGAADHFFDIKVLTVGRYVGLDPNRHTSPIFEGFGISI